MRLLEQQHSDGVGVSLLGVRFLRRFHNLDRQQAYHFEKLTSAFSDRTGVCSARRWHHFKGIWIKSLLINFAFFLTMEICFHFILFPISTKLIERTDVNQIVFISSYLNYLITVLCLSSFQSGGLSNSNKLIRRFLGGLHGIYFIPSEQRRIGVYTVNLLEGKERASVCHQESPLWTTDEFHSIPIASKIKRLLVVCLLVSLRSTRRLIPL